MSCGMVLRLTVEKHKSMFSALDLDGSRVVFVKAKPV
jgi:hypothetical protein